MGRHTKSILTTEGIDRRNSGYYSSPSFVAQFFFDELTCINPSGTSVFDPCIGKEELVEPFLNKGFAVEGLDLFEYEHPYRASVQRVDFLRHFEQIKQSSRPIEADFIVANPPYNCHENAYIREHKSWLRNTFADVGVANMYSMFISAIVESARPGCVIGLLSFDSFLTAGCHAALRAKILSTCRIHHLILCPTNLFRAQKADVRTCLLILEKLQPTARGDEDITKGLAPANIVKTANRCRDRDEFEQLLNKRQFTLINSTEIFLDSTADFKEFVVDCPADVRALFALPRLGSMANCATGISTGNDALYLRQKADAEHNVAFYKNPGSRKFFSAPDAFLPREFLKLADRVPNFIVRNRQLLFRSGIICSSMGVKFGACLLPPGATFGVNPGVFCESEDDIWWLLAYLNSSLVQFLVRGVLLRANMITSGYVARIPVPQIATDERERLRNLAYEAYSLESKGKTSAKLMRMIDQQVFKCAGLSTQSEQHIIEFCNDVVKLA